MAAATAGSRKRGASDAPAGAGPGAGWLTALTVGLAAAAVAHHLLGDALMDRIFSADSDAAAEALSATELTRMPGPGADEPDDVDPTCFDSSGECASWAAQGECESNPEYMSVSCARSCKTCATIKAREDSAAASATASGGADGEDEECVDSDASCRSWAQAGECENNPQFMRTSCAVSCNTCEELKVACDRIESSRAIDAEPGGLNALFERALAEFPQYSPSVLSRQPWILHFENFLQEEEGAALLEHCNASFVRSLAGDRLSPVRTSNQCWCSTDACTQDPRVQALTQRIVEVTGVPEQNAEYAQVVRYMPGEFYKVHHDQNCAPWTPQGVRLLTFFMYINDVEEGGGTRFTDLDLTVQPKKGSAVLWPSVIDANLTVDEPNTHHEALPPISGVKYGTNLWLHMYDFKTPSRKGCKWTTRNTR